MAKKKRRATTTARKTKDLPVKSKKTSKGTGGATVRPRPDDEVLVTFTHGDTRSPVVVGNLWNSKDRPPA
jgi:uncharacterized protein involved in type VI secretion and phage assembly